MPSIPKSGLVAAAALCTGLATAAPACAASFDCANATAPDERAICASRALSDLDVEMATLYRVRLEIPMLMGARGAARDEQMAWLARRAACGADVACLRQSYRRRIAQLDRIIASAMQDYCTRIGICG